MARYPNAQWRPVSNETPGGMTAYTFLVLHIMQGTLAGTDTWFHNSASQVSAHLGVGADGTVYQWVDTADMAWAQAAGNPVGISIEHEGSVPAALTPQQITADSAILAWVHQTHGIPLQVTDDAVAGSGVCGHSTGALQHWGHPNCPGPAIMNQRQQIVDGATSLLSMPVVTGISPISGAAGGGDTVTVTGAGFTGATSVMFGSVPGTNLTVVSDTQLTVTSPPPNASGAVDVTVSTPAGTSAGSPADLFTYAAATAAAPTVTGISRAFDDQFADELGERGEDAEDQPAAGSGGVECLVQAFEAEHRVIPGRQPFGKVTPGRPDRQPLQQRRLPRTRLVPQEKPVRVRQGVIIDPQGTGGDLAGPSVIGPREPSVTSQGVAVDRK